MDIETMNESELLDAAMKQGYNPEFEGEGKKSPKEFLEVAFSHNKVLKERNANLNEQNDELLAQINEMDSKMQRLIQFQEEQKKKAVENAIKKLMVDRKDAIDDADHERVAQIDQQIENEKSVAKSESNPILDEWIRQNPWYIKDNDLGLEADIIAKQLQDTGRFGANDQDYRKLLEQVEKRTKSAFPDRFKNPKKDNPSDVESSRQSPANSSKKTYADLPDDAKKACDQFVRDKILTREQYLETYEWD